MMAPDDFTSSGYLQPAAGSGALSGTISGFGGAAATVVSGIQNGDIRLDVDDTEAWLNRFVELIDWVEGQGRKLRDDAHDVAYDTSLGFFELSNQIRAKIVDRLAGADGSFAHALTEVGDRLRDIYVALRAAMETHRAADRAGADVANGITRSAELG